MAAGHHTKPSPTVLELYRSAYDRGAEGVLFFHIQAGHTEILADLASQIGWNRQVDLQDFYRDYALRRFGAGGCRADVRKPLALLRCCRSRCVAKTSDYSTALTFPGFDGSAEHKLKNLHASKGAERKRWLEERLEAIRTQRPAWPPMPCWRPAASPPA